MGRTSQWQFLCGRAGARSVSDAQDHAIHKGHRMNERIKQIVKKADISMSMTEFTGCLKGQDYLVTDSNLSEMQLEKFAELIVRECADLFDKDEIELSYTMRTIHNTIKEHFGVE